MLWLPAARDPTRWRPYSMSLSSTLLGARHGPQRDFESNRSWQHPEASWLNALICRWSRVRSCRIEDVALCGSHHRWRSTTSATLSAWTARTVTHQMKATSKPFERLGAVSAHGLTQDPRLVPSTVALRLD
jgi:hypothetical protein